MAFELRSTKVRIQCARCKSFTKCEGRSSSSLQQRLPSVKRNEFDDHAKEGDKEAVKELEQFLGDKASLFWHELRYVLPSIGKPKGGLGQA